MNDVLRQNNKEAFLDYIEKLDLKCDHINFFYNF